MPIMNYSFFEKPDTLHKFEVVGTALMSVLIKELVEKPQKGPLCHSERSEESNKFNMLQMRMHLYEF